MLNDRLSWFYGLCHVSNVMCSGILHSRVLLLVPRSRDIHVLEYEDGYLLGAFAGAGSAQI